MTTCHVKETIQRERYIARGVNWRKGNFYGLMGNQEACRLNSISPKQTFYSFLHSGDLARSRQNSQICQNCQIVGKKLSFRHFVCVNGHSWKLEAQLGILSFPSFVLCCPWTVKVPTPKIRVYHRVAMFLCTTSCIYYAKALSRVEPWLTWLWVV